MSIFKLHSSVVVPPIIDAFLRNPTAPDRVAALVVYPMNAMMTSPNAP
jgi:hypothetical protein